MIIPYHTLWKFGAVVALAAICALLYLKLLLPAEPNRTANRRAVIVRAQEVQKLSVLVDSRLDAICSPLESKGVPISQAEVRDLRQRLVDSAKPELPSADKTAVQLCDALLLAIQERERSAASLADTRLKPHASALTSDPKKEFENKQRFFEEGITRRWSENANTYRAQITALRARLGDEGRPKKDAAPPRTTNVQAGDTIVLPRATPVRLKYGSTILPAGLSLRVLARAQDSLTVEYSGETVVVPWP